MRSIMSAGLILASLATTACVPSAPITPPPPVVIADGTTLDEEYALKAERLYAAARTAAEAGVDLGAIQGKTAARVAALDRAAYGATLAVREAYKAGNAASYAEAYRRATVSIGILLRGAGE